RRPGATAASHVIVPENRVQHVDGVALAIVEARAAAMSDFRRIGPVKCICDVARVAIESAIEHRAQRCTIDTLAQQRHAAGGIVAENAVGQIYASDSLQAEARIGIKSATRKPTTNNGRTALAVAQELAILDTRITAER